MVHIKPSKYLSSNLLYEDHKQKNKYMYGSSKCWLQHMFTSIYLTGTNVIDKA